MRALEKTAKLMVFKRVQAAGKIQRRLNGMNQLPRVIEGVTFAGGVAASDTENRVSGSSRVSQTWAWLS